jgi:hypothetical protein
MGTAPLDAPTREIRHEDVGVQVEFGFIEDDPPPGPSFTALERGPSSSPSALATAACGLAGRGFRCNSPSMTSATRCSGAANTSA